MYICIKLFIFNITAGMVEMDIGETNFDLDSQLHPNTSHIHPYMYG